MPTAQYLLSSSNLPDSIVLSDISDGNLCITAHEEAYAPFEPTSVRFWSEVILNDVKLKQGDISSGVLGFPNTVIRFCIQHELPAGLHLLQLKIKSSYFNTLNEYEFSVMIE